MLLLLGVLIGLATVPLAGGRLASLGTVRLRFGPAIFGALAVQIGILTVMPGGNDAMHRVLHLGSYALALLFLGANRRIGGMAIVAIGTLLNLLAIAANGGVMPASARALRAAGELASNDEFRNSAAVHHPRLLFLGDVFAVPNGWPLHNVFSIGDVFIAIGVAIVVHALCGSRLTTRAGARAQSAIPADIAS
jgi:hypothetical protein